MIGWVRGCLQIPPSWSLTRYPNHSTIRAGLWAIRETVRLTQVQTSSGEGKEQQRTIHPAVPGSPGNFGTLPVEHMTWQVLMAYLSIFRFEAANITFEAV